jgi:hypothetical protein
MCTQEHRLLRIDITQDQGQVVLVSQHVFVCVELPLHRIRIADRDHGLDPARDELLVAPSVRNHLFHGDHLDAVLAGE